MKDPREGHLPARNNNIEVCMSKIDNFIVLSLQDFGGYWLLKLVLL